MSSQVSKKVHLSQKNVGSPNSIEIANEGFNIKEEYLSDDDNNEMSDITDTQLNNDLIKGTMISLERPKDEYTSFGEFVAHELRCINSPALRKKLKRTIQRSIIEIAAEDELHINKQLS